MKAKKENKVYQITTDVEKDRYLKQGFDIYDDEGELLEYSPLKKIEYSAYAKLEKELAETKEALAAADKNTVADDEEVLKIMTAYAAEHEIDLGKATTVAGIVKKIQEAVANDQ